MPKTRTDKGTLRCLDDDTAEAIARHRVRHRALSVKLFHEILHDAGVLPAGARVCEATLRRFLKARGLDRPVRGPGKARAKYEMPHPNDLWVADFMHGPRVETPDGQRKAILGAIIDDHSRVTVGARFGFTEETADLLHVLRDAIATYGVPKRFYCDNGPAFSSQPPGELDPLAAQDLRGRSPAVPRCSAAMVILAFLSDPPVVAARPIVAWRTVPLRR